jgi:chromate transporter
MSDRTVANPPVEESKSQPTPSLWDLVLAFNEIALASFGGGLSAWSREIVVVEKKWMEEEEFLSATTMCRILPGANQVNLAVFIGTKFHGIPGAIAAVFGLSALPVLVVLGLGAAYFKFHHVPALQKILHGAAAAAVALTIAMAVKTGRKCLHGLIPIFFFLAVFVMNGILRWPLLMALAIVGPLSVVWAWPRKKSP